MNMSERTYIAYLKRLEEKIMILENENHIPYLQEGNMNKEKALEFTKDRIEVISHMVHET